VTRVVVDEGLWILAFAAEAGFHPPRDERERAGRLAAAELLQTPQVEAVWVLSEEINRAYRRRRYEPPYRGALWKLLRDSLLQVMADSSRTLWLDEWTTVDGDDDHDDDCWVGAAPTVGQGCLLITADDRLRSAWRRSAIPERNGFVVLSIEEARLHFATGD